MNLSGIQIIYVITNEKFRSLQIPPGRTGYSRDKVGRLSKLCLEFIGKKNRNGKLYNKPAPIIFLQSKNTRSITCPLCILLLYAETAKVVNLSLFY